MLLNENAIIFINETQGVIDSMPKYLKEVMDGLKLIISGKRKSVENIMLTDGSTVKLYFYSGLVETSLSAFTRVDFYFYYATEENYDFAMDEIGMKCSYTFNSKGMAIITICVVGSRNVIDFDAMGDLMAHELTHDFQYTLNKKIQTKKDFNDYNKTYIRYLKAKSNNPIIKDISNIMYFLTKQEIHANVNEFSHELGRLKITKEDWKIKQSKTLVYREYASYYRDFVKILDMNDETWEDIRVFTQNNEFFKSGNLLAKERKIKQFKYLFRQFILSKFDGMRKAMDRVINYILQHPL
jgi:hypothetical protein